MPAVEQYRDATRSFRRFVTARYGNDSNGRPKVRWYTAWNEANCGCEPATIGNPYRAGRYWRNLNWQCDDEQLCAVAAGDFVDDGNLFTDINYDSPNDSDSDPEIDRAYLRRYRSGMGDVPRIWALHGYESMKIRNMVRIDQFLVAAEGERLLILQERSAGPGRPIYDLLRVPVPALSPSQPTPSRSPAGPAIGTEVDTYAG